MKEGKDGKIEQVNKWENNDKSMWMMMTATRNERERGSREGKDYTFNTGALALHALANLWDAKRLCQYLNYFKYNRCL